MTGYINFGKKHIQELNEFTEERQQFQEVIDELRKSNIKKTGIVVCEETTVHYEIIEDNYMIFLPKKFFRMLYSELIEKQKEKEANFLLDLKKSLTINYEPILEYSYSFFHDKEYLKAIYGKPKRHRTHFPKKRRNYARQYRK